MCGIAALLGEGAARERMTRMLRVAARRGPEGSRVHVSAAGFVAHAALRFVDEQHNQQPLLSAAGSCLVFNGEIYNWRELNQSYGLGARNDTQVLLFGLQARGRAFLRELDGQFAFIAQLSGAAGSVQTLVGRDKWGICPLCFGYTPEGWLAIGSTCEVVEAAGVRDVKAVPAGTLGIAHGSQLRFECWYRVPATACAAQRSVEPLEVRSFALQRVHSRIPDRPQDLFTTLGGIDSQFVTASVARRLHGEFGGAVTIVPWSATASELTAGGDYPFAKATLELLAAEGIQVAHHVAVLTPAIVEHNLDRLLKLLGPDLFHVLCGLAEDLVADTVRRLGGRTILTAGGPDEAGRSYERWTFLHRGLDEELAWRRLAEQFASSEGVRAGLVFGEHGIENRVPLADLIEFATQMRAEQKQQVYDEGDGLTLASMRMHSKIVWRQALSGLLPERCLAARKEPIQVSTGAMGALYEVLSRDLEFARCRSEFALRAWYLGWNGIVFGDLRNLDPAAVLTECQLYALYRWSRLAPELFACGGVHRYGPYVDYLPRCEDEPTLRQHKPLCFDWQLGRDVPLRAIL